MSRKPNLRPKLQVVESDGKPIMDAATAKKRFAVYFAVKLLGLAALFGGVFLGQDGIDVPSVALLLMGAASLFVRPRMLGLTTSTNGIR